MSRLKADLLLLLAAIIWGAAFVAQKTAMEEIGAFTFSGIRFAIALPVILPFLLRERRQATSAIKPADRSWIVAVGCAFFAGVVVQQIGMISTSVTNAGFLTSLYVVLTPVVALLLFKMRPNRIVWLAAPLCVFGVWLLGSGALEPLNYGDFLMIAAAFFFALHIVLVGFVLARCQRPFTVIASQYAICAGLSLLCALFFEEINIASLYAVLPQILYAGIISGGIAYSSQVVAQQHTPASDAAIILSSEALFAALAGVIIMGDRLPIMAWAGCGVIFTAILMVELYPLFRRRKTKLQ